MKACVVVVAGCGWGGVPGSGELKRPEVKKDISGSGRIVKR
jgi:hypothetical protein